MTVDGMECGHRWVNQRIQGSSLLDRWRYMAAFMQHTGGVGFHWDFSPPFAIVSSNPGGGFPVLRPPLPPGPPPPPSASSVAGSGGGGGGGGGGGTAAANSSYGQWKWTRLIDRLAEWPLPVVGASARALAFKMEPHGEKISLERCLGWSESFSRLLLLLFLLLPQPTSKESSLVHSYKHGFNGFSAFLTEAEADSIAKLPGVVKVFRSKKLSLHTTRSWDFLDSFSGGPHIQINSSSGSDVIVGVLDTGVWPESKSFDDAGMGPVPKRWKGVCDNSKITNHSHTIHCNKKIVGARSYGHSDVRSRYQNARDQQGHGTHTASTIAGSLVKDATFLTTLGKGVARGGHPSARLAIYRICTPVCDGDNVLAAFDDAIHDGVDIVSLSLGLDDGDSISIGAFHAMQKGIFVSCSAGNGGPGLQTIENSAPWILTVGASTIDRKFSVDINLGNSKTIQVKGKIVLCNYSPGVASSWAIQRHLKELGASGVILAIENTTEAVSFLDLAGAAVTGSALDEINAYLKNSRNTTATISPAHTIIQTTPAPIIADFSSRGPDITNDGILKPDLVAPGVDILAAWSPEQPINYYGKPMYTDFNIISGTSMGCPHASAAAAFVKSRHPSWSPAAIKSALMTTARFLDNTKSPIKDHNGEEASPFVMGAGQIDPVAALSPGLVYDISPDEYTKFLCTMNYTRDQLELMTGKNLSCAPLDSYVELNYPSIAVPIAQFGGPNSTKAVVNRKVTNVGAGKSVYNISVEAPAGVTVAVFPPQLRFKSVFQVLSFQIQFTVDSSKFPQTVLWGYGTLTWKSEKHSVRSVFILGLN
ncbi:CO(2)-response secreted protease [Selaginella moellendorffii]|uniref:CO(2)-response secreted protease n=1 Tax=Selaginella moellendorffii TaxID=88036 RepID=UPI000D1C9EED|nr:CO(2)-response secreted protease [Selaginella moellendorffii]|eukprot:XP_024517063.1 CO(2)-response secreted protease [Selaginella moellendorffii]